MIYWRKKEHPYSGAVTIITLSGVMRQHRWAGWSGTWLPFIPFVHSGLFCLSLCTGSFPVKGMSGSIFSTVETGGFECIFETN